MIIFRMKPIMKFGELPNGDEYQIYLSGYHIKKVTTTAASKPSTVDKDFFIGCFVKYVSISQPTKKGFIYKTEKGAVKLIEESHIEERLKRALTTQDVMELCEALSEPIPNIRHLLEFISL